MKKFTKEDIASAFACSFTELSLLVLGADATQQDLYTEFALLSLGGNPLSEEALRDWAAQIPRLRDVFIYEKVEKPLRVRLKALELDYQSLQLTKKRHRTEEESLWDWVAEQTWHFDPQSPPLFCLRNIEISGQHFLLLAYHHLLFDGISVQYALSLLKSGSAYHYIDWNPPMPTSLPSMSILESRFRLQDYLPPAALGAQGFEYIDLPLNCEATKAMALWLQFLQEASGSNNIVLGEVFSARGAEAAGQAAMGYFVQTWPLALDMKVGESTEALSLRLQAAREQLQNLAHLPLNKVMPGVNFDWCWVLEPSVEGEVKVDFRSKPHYALSLVFKGKTLNFTWNCAKVDVDAAREITKSFERFLQGASAEEPASEQRFEPKALSVLEIWNKIHRQYAAKPAVGDYLGNHYNYQALEEAATRLAARLPVQVGDRVGVRLSYSAYIPLAYLAILKKGAIYVPLDPSIASTRYQYIVEDAGLKCLISDLEEDSPLTKIHPIQETAAPTDFQAHIAKGSEVVYLIYTSGTTGNPKGCAVTHQNLANLFEGAAECFNFSAEDRWILAHSYGFDFSTWEIWGALLNGAYLWIPDKTQVQDSFQFYEILQEQRISILNQTPRAFDNLMLVSEGEKALSALRYLIFGGDKLTINKIQTWLQKHPQLKAVNMYGITETTVHVTYQEIRPTAQSEIGLPLPGYTLTTCNALRQPTPQGFIGELRVGGYGVCAGYFGKTALTAEKFEYSDSGSYYFSGDLGWYAKGSFYYLGRNDRQVKIRGYRIELGEIETLMQQALSNIKIRVLFIDQQYLVAFYTASKMPLHRTLFKDTLPDYAIPAFFVEIADIPLNANGKTDEAKLMQCFRNTQDKKAPENSAESPLEKALLQILGSQADMNRSFVQNGGDSISAIRLLNLLKKEGYQLSVATLFEASALRELNANALSVDNSENTAALSALGESLKQKYKSSSGEIAEALYPLLDAQLGILFDALASGEQSVYVEQLCYELPGTFSTLQIKSAYQALWEALPALRLQLIKLDADYYWILKKSKPIITERDFSSLPDASAEWQHYLQKDFENGFDLFGDLMRLSIIRISASELRLVWTHHHLLMDGWSLGAFSQLFINALSGNLPTGNPNKVYLDFLLQQALNRQQNQGLLPYWQERLKGLDKDALIPYTQQKTSNRILEYRQQISLDKLTDIRTKGLTSNSLMLAAWLCFLQRCFGKNDLVLGAVQSRRSAGLSEAIGMLIKTLPFRYQFVNAHQSFEQIALAMATQQRRDLENMEAPLQELSQLGESLAHLFVFENYPIDQDALSTTGIRVGAYREQTGADWTTIVYPEGNHFSLRILAKESLYAADYIEALLSGFERWCKTLHWDSIPQNMPLALEGESTFAGAERPDFLADRTSILHILQRKSENTFLIYNGKFLSYQFLWEEASHWSEILKAKGLKAGQAVGIEVHQTRDFVIAILAVWLAEGVCCSVDYRYPEQRKTFIWENAACYLKFYENADKNEPLQLQELPIRKDVVHSTDASFILHTSGSTGQPKGVIQTHDCLLNLIAWNRASFGLEEQERILQLSSFGFDASYHEVLLALSLGATLVQMPLEQRLDIDAIRKTVLDNAVTLAWIPARLLNAVLDADAHYFDACLSLKNIVTTGEALTIGDTLKAWLERSSINLLNYYGPTETHVVTALAVNKENCSPVPPIGWILPNCILQLCDVAGREVLHGLPGEIWVAGPHLALGYLNLPEQSAERFLMKEGQLWYKTGDWGRMRADGLLEFLGRKDDQVKIRGFRVEPIEVERLLLQVPGIRQACVLVEKTTEIRLLAFYVGEAELDEQLRSACLSLMPDYMLPAYFFKLATIPLNENGKADRKQLKTLYLENKAQNIGTLPENSMAVSCWVHLLGHRNFDMYSAFQSVGGNSIMLMKMQAWLEKQEGLSFSIQELLKANTPARLDALLAARSQASAVHSRLAARFPLNYLQKAILWNELGNEYEKSPYRLSFTVRLKNPVSEQAFSAAWEKILEIYPHLAYSIECSEDLKIADWVQVPYQLADFFKPFPEGKFSLKGPFIRFALQQEQLTLTWHHLLLDGQGLRLLINALLGNLSGQWKKTAVDFSSLIQATLPEKQAQVLACSDKARRFVQTLPADSLPSPMFHFLMSVLHWQLRQQEGGLFTAIAFADARYASGLPGMFTFLNISVLDWTAIKTLQDLLEAVATSLDNSPTMPILPISRVVNFMEEELPKELIVEYEAQMPEICKYPLEYQWIVKGDSLHLELIASVDDFGAAQDWSAFMQLLEQFSALAPDAALPLSSAVVPELDDFDF